LALQEQKARQASLNVPTPVTIMSARKTVRTEMQTFLTNRPQSWQYILGVFDDFFGWDKDPATFQRADFKAYAAHLSASKTPFVVVDLEGTASKIVVYAISRADLVIIPTQGSQLDANEASRAIRVVMQSQKMTKTGTP
jgi:hypothetical protein